MRSLCMCALVLISLNTYAQSDTPLNVITQPPVEPKDSTVTISDLGWMDKNKMDKEVQGINELAQAKLGASLHKDLNDLQVLQRMIDNDLIKQDDYQTQQAMGVVMGNVFLADFPQTLEWKVYRDKLGRSRALCAKGTQQCMFPITMLSRRMEVGSKPNVKKIYNDTVDMMKDYLPQIPYGGGIMHRLQP